MFAVLALVFALLSYILHGSQASVPVWFDWTAFLIAAVAALAAHLMWPTWRRPVP